MTQTEILPDPAAPHWLGARRPGGGRQYDRFGRLSVAATLAPTGSSSIIGWLICGLGAVTLALVFGGLGRMQPDADGLSDFTRRGMGRFIGYQTGLAYWGGLLGGQCGARGGGHRLSGLLHSRA